MHILTKFFAVAASILAIVVSALTVTYAANADRITADYTNARLRAETVEAAASDAARQHDIEVRRLEAVVQELRDERSTLEAQLTRIEGQNVQLVADKRAAETSRASLESRIGQLGETSKTQVTLIGSYKDEVSGLRDNELRYRKEQLELEDRINDLESQNEVLTQTARALREQLTELRGLVGGEGSLASAGSEGSSSETFLRAGAPVRGEVLEVMRGVNGRLMVRIDLGRNDDIRENMKLFVSRGDSFLANVRITETDNNTAIGELDPLGRNVQVREGDTVLSRLR